MVSVLLKLRIRGKIPSYLAPSLQEKHSVGRRKDFVGQGAWAWEVCAQRVGAMWTLLCVSIGTQLAFYNDLLSRQKKVCQSTFQYCNETPVLSHLMQIEGLFWLLFGRVNSCLSQRQDRHWGRGFSTEQSFSPQPGKKSIRSHIPNDHHRAPVL